MAIFNNRNPHFLRKMTLYVVIGAFLLFLITSFGSMLQSKMNISSNSLQKWTTHISLETFMTAFSMEIPQLETYNKSTGIELPKASNVLFELVTSFNPSDPRSLIRSEIPGFIFFDGEIIVAGEGAHYSNMPIESSPPLDVVMAERDAVRDGVNGQGDHEAEEEPSDPPQQTTEGREVVFVYHTHNHESFLPHLPSVEEPDRAYHPETNITLVGERLGEELQKRGIGTYVDTSDITGSLLSAGWQYNRSYEKSRQMVQTVMAERDDIHFVFDLHRDSQRKDITTVEIDGEKFARTLFIIGARNKNHQQNTQFAKKFHELLEEAYPGLSRGIFTRNQGEYNQSLSEHNILIEIGGVDNTLEEAYRTAAALADIIADLYWEAEKVDAAPEDVDM